MRLDAARRPRATRWTTAWTTFANAEKTWAYRQDQLPSTHPIAADILDIEAVEANFDGITYAKGASRPQAAGRLGRPGAVLRPACGVLPPTTRTATPTLTDLLDELEEASPAAT